MIRAFIALDIADNLRTEIAQVITGLRAQTGRSVRWVDPKNIHLTLKFLGDTPPANVKFLSQMLRSIADTQSAFEMQLADLGVFPNPNRPRVIHLEVHQIPALRALQLAVELAAAKLNYPAETRPFSPHFTLGRVRQPLSAADLQQLRSALQSLKLPNLPKVRIEELVLFQSDLTPQGPIYSRLSAATFNHLPESSLP